MRRRDLLAGGGLAVAGGLLGGRAHGSGVRKLITVAAYGGWDTSLALDPKLGVAGIDGPELDEDPDDPDDREELATLAGIPLVVNPVKRPEVTRFFETWGHRAVVVNGLSMAAISHQSSVRRILTGSGTGELPDLGAVLGAEIAGFGALGYVDLANQSHLARHPEHGASWATTSARLGERDQLRVLLEPGYHPAPPAGAPAYPRWSPDEPTRDRLAAYLAEAGERFVASRAGEAGAAQLATDAAEATRRAGLLRRIGGPLAAGLESGPGTSLSTNAETAVDGLAAGLWHAALIDSGWGWDSHVDNPVQHRLWNDLCTGLDDLLVALDAAGILDETLVVVTSEMTRTPLRNVWDGKDHWPWASAIVLGGGVSGGRVVGATDDSAIGLPIDLATGEHDPSGVVPSYANFVAGLMARLDLDPDAYLPGAVPLAL